MKWYSLDLIEIWMTCVVKNDTTVEHPCWRLVNTNSIEMQKAGRHIDLNANIVSKILFIYDCMLLSCHVRVSEWIHTLFFVWMSGNTLHEAGAKSKV